MFYYKSFFIFLTLFSAISTLYASAMNGPSCRVWANLSIPKDKSMMQLKITKTKRFYFWGLKGDCTFIDSKAFILESPPRINPRELKAGTYFIEAGVERVSHTTEEGITYSLYWQPILFTADSKRLDIESFMTSMPSQKSN